MWFDFIKIVSLNALSGDKSIKIQLTSNASNGLQIPPTNFRLPGIRLVCLVRTAQNI